MIRNTEENQQPSLPIPAQPRKRTSIYLLLKQLLESYSRQFLPYFVEGKIIDAPATRIAFVYSPRSQQQYCLKVWKACDDEPYNTSDKTKWIDYLLEGWRFNRRFANGVYVGIAPMRAFEVNARTIELSGLIRTPNEKKLRTGQLEAQKEYALVMRHLDEDWRLDEQLSRGNLGTKLDIEFLAAEIVRMHGMLEASPKDMGTTEHIRSKLGLNTHLFERALDKLAWKSFDTRKYGFVSRQMKEAYERCIDYFRLRYQTGHIKRCHGDLKATNLWVQPERTLFCGLQKFPRCLLALDCVDFNPSFCHIDMLSDVAMLAIDIEAHLVDRTIEAIREQTGKEPVQYFLEGYLEKIREKSTKPVWSLLEYYMTEKAMICAYMSVLYDKLPGLGKRYLDIALIHARKLRDLLTT